MSNKEKPSMNTQEVNMVLDILDLALKYGIPFVKSAIENSGKTELTKEDIENLKIDAQWDNYFDE
jgi:hypothetical protein